MTRMQESRDRWTRLCAEAEIGGAHVNFNIGTNESDGKVFTAVHVASFGRDESKLISPDVAVISDEAVAFEYDYPLRNKVRFEHTLPGGFTRREVYRLAHDDYARIYAEEDAAVGDPGTIHQAIGGKRGCQNRMRSKGPYGIWGHYMGDLYIEGCQYDSVHKVLRFYMGS